MNSKDSAKYIAIDSNALPDGWQLRSKTVKAFIQYLQSTNSRLLLSDVVRIEIEAKFKRECKSAVGDMDSALRRLRKLGIQVPPDLDIEIVIAGALSTWEQDIAEILSPDIIERIPIDDNLMEEIVRRLAERIPPSSPAGEQFRDCVIWLSLLKYAQNNPSHRPIILISNDKKSFSNDKISLRPELQAELKNQGLEISYYASLKNFLKDQNVELPEEDGEMRLTGGSLTVRGLSGGPLFQFIGPEFTISNKGADQGNVGAWHCSPCRVGERLNLNSTFAGELGLGSGPACIKGNQYQHLYYTGVIDFYGEVEIEESELAQVFIIGKFTFSGFLNGYEGNPFIGDPGRPIFDVKLSGSGAATVELSGYLTPTHGRLYDFRSITYRFEQ